MASRGRDGERGEGISSRTRSLTRAQFSAAQTEGQVVERVTNQVQRLSSMYRTSRDEMQDIMAQMQASMKVISEQQADIVQLRQSLIQQQALQVPTTLQSQTSAPNQSVSTTAQTQQGQPNTGATNPIQHQTQTLPPNTNTALLTPAIGQTTYIAPPIPPP